MIWNFFRHLSQSQQFYGILFIFNLGSPLSNDKNSLLDVNISFWLIPKIPGEKDSLESSVLWLLEEKDIYDSLITFNKLKVGQFKWNLSENSLCFVLHFLFLFRDNPQFPVSHYYQQEHG